MKKSINIDFRSRLILEGYIKILICFNKMYQVHTKDSNFSVGERLVLAHAGMVNLNFLEIKKWNLYIKVGCIWSRLSHGSLTFDILSSRWWTKQNVHATKLSCQTKPYVPAIRAKVFYNINYRVSHSEVYKVNQLWGIEGSIILLNYGP